MLSFVVPVLARNIADRYKDLLESVSHKQLCAYIAAFVLGADSFADMVRQAPWTSSLSTMSAQLNEITPDNLNRAMRRLRIAVLKKVLKNPEQWILAFDTTSNPKRMQDLIGSGLWATSKGSIFEGRNLMVVTVVNICTGHAIPIAFAPCIKPKDDPENGKSAWKLLLDLLDALVVEHFPLLPIVGDSWFDGVEFLKELDKRGFVFNIELKSSRKATASTFPNEKRKLLKTHLQDEKKQQAKVGTSRKADAKAKIKFVAIKVLRIQQSKVAENGKRPQIRVSVAAVYNHQAEKTPFAFYATNDLSKSGVWQWRMSRLRWNIEVLFRDLKQELMWGKFSFGSQIGNDACIVLPFLILTYLRLDVDIDGNKTIGEILSYTRQAEELRSIEFILRNPEHGLYEKYKARMNPDRACKKPVDTVAENNISWNIRMVA